MTQAKARVNREKERWVEMALALNFTPKPLLELWEQVRGTCLESSET